MATKLLQNKVLEFVSILTSLKLRFNTSKTNAMYMTKGARKTPLISISGDMIKPVKSIKFLSRTIKNSLYLKENYEDVSSSCSTSLKAMKIKFLEGIWVSPEQQRF